MEKGKNMNLDVSLPWPPSSNRYWRMWNHRLIISREARDYKRDIKQLYYTWPIKRLQGRLELTINAMPPDKRARDLDNLLKITIDSLESTGIFENDSQIDKITIERGNVIKDGSLTISLSTRV